MVPPFVPRPGVVPEAGVPGPGGDVPGAVVALVPVGGGVPGGTAVGAAGSGTGVVGAGSTIAVVGGGGSGAGTGTGSVTTGGAATTAF